MMLDEDTEWIPGGNDDSLADDMIIFGDRAGLAQEGFGQTVTSSDGTQNFDSVQTTPNIHFDVSDDVGVALTRSKRSRPTASRAAANGFDSDPAFDSVYDVDLMEESVPVPSKARVTTRSMMNRKHMERDHDELFGGDCADNDGQDDPMLQDSLYLKILPPLSKDLQRAIHEQPKTEGVPEGLSGEDLIRNIVSELTRALKKAYDKHKDRLGQVKEIRMNMGRVNNAEFRSKIIRGQITPQQLATMSTADMAPSSLRQKRRAQQEKYLREQVIIAQDTGPIVRKTHKGIEFVEEAVAVEKEPVEDTTEKSDELVESIIDPRLMPREVLYSPPVLKDVTQGGTLPIWQDHTYHYIGGNHPRLRKDGCSGESYESLDYLGGSWKACSKNIDCKLELLKTHVDSVEGLDSDVKWSMGVRVSDTVDALKIRFNDIVEFLSTTEQNLQKD